MDVRFFSTTAVDAAEKLAEQKSAKPASAILVEGCVLSTFTGIGIHVIRNFFQQFELRPQAVEYFLDATTVSILSMMDYSSAARDIFILESLVYHLTRYKLPYVARDGIKAGLLSFDFSNSLLLDAGKFCYATMYSMVGKTLGEGFVRMNDDLALADGAGAANPGSSHNMAKA